MDITQGGDRGTYIKQKLLHLSIVIALLEIHVPNSVNNEDLPILSNNALLRARNTSRRVGGGHLSLRRLNLLLRLLLLRVLLLHASLPTVHRLHSLGITIRRRRRLGPRIHTGDSQSLSPRRASRKLDIPPDKLLLSLPAQVQGEVMSRAADEDEQASKHGAEAGAESRVVVTGALPDREAVGEEMVVARALRALEEFLDEAEAGEAVGGGFGGGVDFGV